MAPDVSAWAKAMVSYVVSGHTHHRIEGETHGESLADVKSAIQFHVEAFGAEAFGMEGQ
jgi:hypothetical protein